MPPELLFDAGFGELFVVRLAGNVVSAEVEGTLQYAGVHLRTPLFVVLGHEGCGAVKAALAAKFHGARAHRRIEVLLQSILPGLDAVAPGLPAKEQLRVAVEANVRWTVRQILETPEAKARQAEGVMKLVGAVAELSTGVVRFLDGATKCREQCPWRNRTTDTSGQVPGHTGESVAGEVGCSARRGG